MTSEANGNDLAGSWGSEEDEHAGDWLQRVLSQTHWSVKEGIKNIVGYPSYDLKRYVNKVYYFTYQDGVRLHREELQQLLDLWNEQQHPEQNPPTYVIEWANSKNIDIAWLDEAITRGLYRKTSAAKLDSLSETDRQRAIALLTVINNYGHGNRPPRGKQEEIYNRCINEYADAFTSDVTKRPISHKTFENFLQRCRDAKIISKSSKK